MFRNKKPFFFRFNVLSILVAVLLIFPGSNAISKEPPPSLTLNKTKNQIKSLDTRISTLQRNLATVNNKKTVIHRELAETDRQISQVIVHLKALKGQIETLENALASSRKETKILREQLETQQKQLAGYVRARYQTGSLQSLKWILHQEDPHTTTRLFTYYRYLIQSRQKIIAEVETIRKKIEENNILQEKDLVSRKLLHQEQLASQEKLTKDKAFRVTLINTLKNEIQSHESALSEARLNRKNLGVLLQTLSENPAPISSGPFHLMRKKLPYPVYSKARSLQKMNQGVTFLADEGIPVLSVFPGKVVFSDWLRGYGLLLIIDHGQGYMTLYAHNQALFIHRGQNVRQRQVIASVGHTGDLPKNGLYFEVRHRGKAIPALEWFP